MNNRFHIVTKAQQKPKYWETMIAPAIYFYIVNMLAKSRVQQKGDRISFFSDLNSIILQFLQSTQVYEQVVMCMTFRYRTMIPL